MAIQVKEKDLLTLESLGADFESSSTELNIYVLVSVQIFWSGVTDGTKDGSLEIQSSNNDVDFTLIGAAKVIDSAAGSFIFEIPDFASKYIRISYTKNAITTGTVSARLVAKSFE
jgi:hypothetical protein